MCWNHSMDLPPPTHLTPLSPPSKSVESLNYSLDVDDDEIFGRKLNFITGPSKCIDEWNGRFYSIWKKFVKIHFDGIDSFMAPAEETLPLPPDRPESNFSQAVFARGHKDCLTLKFALRAIIQVEHWWEDGSRFIAAHPPWPSSTSNECIHPHSNRVKLTLAENRLNHSQIGSFPGGLHSVKSFCKHSRKQF